MIVLGWIGCILMVILGVVAWIPTDKVAEDFPYRFAIMLVVALLLILYGFGLPR